MIVVGFGHVARTGKSTASQALIRDLGFTEVSFAAKLKELALEADPIVVSAQRTINTAIGHGKLAWIVKGMGGWEVAKDQYPEVRTFLEKLGAGCRKVFGEDFWVKQALTNLDADKNYVVSDVRYLSEVQAIRDLGGFVFKITRPAHSPSSSRPSELDLADWDGWDTEFDNSGGVHELEVQVVDHVRALLKQQSTQQELPYFTRPFTLDAEEAA
jgi:hypothetical protein